MCAENLAHNFLIFACCDPSACSSRAYSRIPTNPQLHLPQLIWLTSLPGIAKRLPCSLGVIGVPLERAYRLSCTATQSVTNATSRVLQFPYSGWLFSAFRIECIISIPNLAPILLSNPELQRSRQIPYPEEPVVGPLLRHFR